jgi:hypothetical protein
MKRRVVVDYNTFKVNNGISMENGNVMIPATMSLEYN